MRWPIKQSVISFEKYHFFAGSHVSITLRHLISHLAGLRQTTDADLLHEYNLHLVNSTQTVAWFSNEPLLSKVCQI